MWPFKTKPAAELVDAYLATSDDAPVLAAEPVLRVEVFREAASRHEVSSEGNTALLRLLVRMSEHDTAGIFDELAAAWQKYRAKHDKDKSLSADARRAVARIDRLLSSGASRYVDGDWGRTLIAPLPGAGAAWDDLLELATQAAGKARPTAKWERQAAALVAQLDTKEFTQRLEAAMTSAKLGYTHQPQWGSPVETGISDREQDLLKGLVWASATIRDASFAHALGSFGERCFRKIPEFGAASTRLGNACIHALSAMPDGIGVAHLSRLTEKVRYRAGKRSLDRALDDAAERAGQTREDIEELAVPDAGLDASSTKRVTLGDHTAELVVTDDLRVELRWLKPDGKPQASPPKAVKEAHGPQVKALTKEQRQLQDLVAGQTARLQRLWLADRRLPLGDLRKRYLEHPVVGPIARRLVWLAGDTMLRWHDGALVTLGGVATALPDDTEARLWHPIDGYDVDELLVWRDLFDSRGIVQPFKQLWREVYKPRSGEVAQDDRYAGHIVRQHPFRNLCQQRGWQYNVQGYWDSANYPQLTLSRWDIGVTLEVEALAHQRDSHLFEYLVVGSLTFQRRVAGGVPLGVNDVPPIVFSEVMRDVDMFVGVSTVANDPKFDPTGFEDSVRNYWAAAVFGNLAPLAETRREVLARVLPRTTLRDRARLDDRWLVVDGAAGKSRIHLGTGQVQRASTTEPFDLEIDRDARTRAAAVFLPFEGDSILADILAKALVLAGE